MENTERYTYITEWFELSEGEGKLVGYVQLPDREGKLPTVIMCHGLGGYAGGIEPYTARLAERGYAMVGFAFRFGGPCSESGNDTQKMTLETELADLERVFTYVKGLPWINRDRLFLLGGSHGGLIATLYASREEHWRELKALLLMTPGLHIPDEIRHGRLFAMRFDTNNLPDILKWNNIIFGREYLEGAKTLRPFEALAEIQVPILLLHGTADTVIPQTVTDLAAETNPLIDYKVIEGGDHCFAKQKTAKAYDILADFLDKQFEK